MMNLKITSLKSWVAESVREVTKTGLPRDIHVDELIDVAELSNEELIHSCLELFDKMAEYFKNDPNKNGLSIYLSVELTEHSNKIKGAPGNFQSLCDEYDQYSMPEIIIYKPLPITIPSMVEIYRRPLTFKEFSNFEECLFFYKEDRTVDMIEDDIEFRREFNIIYLNQ